MLAGLELHCKLLFTLYTYCQLSWINQTWGYFTYEHAWEFFCVWIQKHLDWCPLHFTVLQDFGTTVCHLNLCRLSVWLVFKWKRIMRQPLEMLSYGWENLFSTSLLQISVQSGVLLLMVLLVSTCKWGTACWLPLSLSKIMVHDSSCVLGNTCFVLFLIY